MAEDSIDVSVGSSEALTLWQCEHQQDEAVE